MVWYLGLVEFLVVYWGMIFFHELGHWFLIKVYKVPFVMTVNWFPFRLLFRYKATKKQSLIITLAGILNGLGFLLNYYLWGSNTIILYACLLIYTMGCAIDFWAITRYVQ